MTTKMVLLPGMDGTGFLFRKFVAEIPELETTIIKFPADAGEQSYAELVELTKSKLPKDNYILLAESFSGPIAAQLAFEKPANLKGVIYVATFLSPPKPLLITLAKFAPIRLLTKMPTASFFMKYLMLGNDATETELSEFKNILDGLPARTIRARLQSIARLKIAKEKSDLPALYLRAESDRLVPTTKGTEFKRCFSALEIVNVDGPHFLLQSQPEQCAAIVQQFIADLTILK